MKSDILLSLIKEVVKNEVKTQVRQQVISEITKLVKSGAVTLNSNRKPQAPTLKEAIATTDPFAAASAALQKSRASVPQQQQRVQQPQKEYTKNSALNEILNMTQPFTAAQRAEGGGSGGSVLDMLQPQMSVEEDGWETMDYRE
jgi:NAD-specific glutamate dehydrogenase